MRFGVKVVKSKGEYDSKLNEITELYKDVKDAYISKELTAELVGEYLFTDEAFVNNLSTKNRNVFQKIYDEIKYLCKTVTAGSKEARQLEKVKRVFDKAYKAEVYTPQFENSAVRYAIENIKSVSKYKSSIFSIDLESKNNAKSRGNKVIESESEIIDAINNSLNNKSLKENYIIGSIPESVKNKISKDTTNELFKNGVYVFNISSDDIRHIKKHFNNTTEIINAVYRLYDVVCDYDLVELSNKNGQNRLTFKKRYDDYDFLSVEIASKKTRSLDLVTFYITKNNKKAKDKIQHPANKKLATQVISSSAINIISENPENVNENISALKQKQFEIISKNNPSPDEYHTWIRKADDIKTFAETLSDSNWEEYSDFDPDYTWDMAQEALKSGKITIYSSYPIEQGVFVTPSKMEAESYSGNNKVYTKTVRLDNVAWIDPTQGMYAEVNEVAAKNVNGKLSLLDSNAASEQQGGYKVYGKDIVLGDDFPIRSDIKPKQKTQYTVDAPVRKDIKPKGISIEDAVELDDVAEQNIANDVDEFISQKGKYISEGLDNIKRLKEETYSLYEEKSLKNGLNIMFALHFSLKEVVAFLLII